MHDAEQKSSSGNESIRDDQEDPGLFNILRMEDH